MLGLHAADFVNNVANNNNYYYASIATAHATQQDAATYTE